MRGEERYSAASPEISSIDSKRGGSMMMMYSPNTLINSPAALRPSPFGSGKLLIRCNESFQLRSLCQLVRSTKNCITIESLLLSFSFVKFELEQRLLSRLYDKL